MPTPEQTRYEKFTAAIQAVMSQRLSRDDGVAVLQACKKSAELGWREIDLPPGVTIVSADEEFKVIEQNERSTSFSRDFKFSENGEVKDGVYNVIGESTGLHPNSDYWVSEGRMRSGYFDERHHWDYSIPADTPEERIEKVAMYAWDCVFKKDGIEKSMGDLFTVRHDGDLLVAEVPVRFWAPDDSRPGKDYGVVPEVGVYRVTIDKTTDELVSVECTGRDGSLTLGTFQPDHYEDMHPATKAAYAPRAAAPSIGLTI